jgi:hypothetical protein
MGAKLEARPGMEARRSQHDRRGGCLSCAIVGSRSLRKKWQPEADIKPHRMWVSVIRLAILALTHF